MTFQVEIKNINEKTREISVPGFGVIGRVLRGKRGWSGMIDLEHPLGGEILRHNERPVLLPMRDMISLLCRVVIDERVISDDGRYKLVRNKNMRGIVYNLLRSNTDGTTYKFKAFVKTVKVGEATYWTFTGTDRKFKTSDGAGRSLVEATKGLNDQVVKFTRSHN